MRLNEVWQTLLNGGIIERESWTMPDGTNKWVALSKDDHGCLCLTAFVSGFGPWVPTLEDLTANDWREVVLNDLSFQDALNALAHGKKIHKKSWPKGQYLYFDKHGELLAYSPDGWKGPERLNSLTFDDDLWEVVRDE